MTKEIHEPGKPQEDFMEGTTQSLALKNGSDSVACDKIRENVSKGIEM